jgi:hypothetical protein
MIPDVAFAALAATVGAAVVYLFVRAHRQRRERDFERRVYARKLGWSYVGERDGRIDYRFSGASDGVAWTMWYDSDRGDESPTPKAIWKTANLRTPRLSLVIIGTPRFRLESGPVGRLMMGVITGVAQSLTGSDTPADKAEFYESAVVLDQTRPSFREQLTVAVSPEMPREWLDTELQDRLTRWPKPGGGDFDVASNLEVTLCADGLQIVAQRMPEDIGAWRHLADLGQAVASRLAAHSSGRDG